MQVRLVCVEDGLENIGFKKFAGYVLWKIGVIKFWQRFMLKRYHLPKEKSQYPSEISSNTKNI